MSIEQLQSDLDAIKKALPSGALVTTDDLHGFLKHNLLPFIESHVAETVEIDESVEALVANEPDILHEDTATEFHSALDVFEVVTKELAERMGNDARLLSLVKESRGKLDKCRSILDEITVAEPDDEPDSESDAEPAAEKTSGTP